MARPSATAALLVLLVSLLAVAHCRPIEAEPATDAESAAVAAVISDDNGPPNPALPAEAGAADVVLPAEQVQHGFLRLPSHRLHRHRPCRHGPFHRHLWWARHHGAFGDDDAPRRFHHRRHIEFPSHLPVLPAHETMETEEAKAVAEPDPDRSLADGEGEVVARMEPSFGDADGAAAAHEDEGAAVRAWRKEMRRRWFQFHHNGMRLHRPHHHDVEEGHEQEEEAAEGVKQLHHHHRHDEDDEDEKHMTRKRFRHAEHDADGDDEDDEVEELVRRFRKAIMRRRFGSHGHHFHHHRRRHFGGHRHTEEEAEKADAREDGGVVSWIKGLMNRF